MSALQNAYKNKKEQPLWSFFLLVSYPFGVTPAGFKPATF